MKMETSVVAHTSGVVKEIFVRSNMQVNAGDSLLAYDPVTAEDQSSARPAVHDRSSRINFTQLAGQKDAHASWLDVCRTNLEASKISCVAMIRMQLSEKRF